MSDYNIQMHDYNGAGYDNLYPKTKSNMVLDGDTNLETKLKYYSNENLLDNWYFVGGGSQQGSGQFPINQRGQTSYSGVGYGIDRWVLQDQADTLVLENDYITLTTGAVGSISQSYEAFHSICGKTVTLSVLARINSGTLGVTAIDGVSWKVGDIALPSQDVQLLTSTFMCESSASMLSLFFSGRDNADIDFIAAKLELGVQKKKLTLTVLY